MKFMMAAQSILVVEDDANDVFLLKRAFLKSGLNVKLSVARDGQEAIQYLDGEPPFENRGEHPLPSLLLLDLKMPRLTGFDVLRWVRNQEGLRRLLVVVLTSSAEASDVNQAFDLGANSYLTKPPSFEALQDLVQVVERYWFKSNQCPTCDQV